MSGVAPVRLCDGFVARRLGSATTKRRGDSNAIGPVIRVGYCSGPPSAGGWAEIARARTTNPRSALGSGGGANNIAERARKMAILHRKNSLSFKTLHGARIGAGHSRRRHNCEFNQVHPFDYLLALPQHAAAVAKAPELWRPWHAQQTIAAAGRG